MPTAVVNDIRMNYYVNGKGPDVILIHGLAASLAFWHFRIFPVLARHYRVMAYDLRGHGRTEIPASGYTTMHLAEDLRKLMNHLEIEKAQLVGHSFGGAVALELTLNHPERVTSVTVADTRLRALQEIQQIRDWPFWSLWKSHVEASGGRVPSDEETLDFTLLDDWASLAVRIPHLGTSTAEGILPVTMWRGRERSRLKWLELVRSTSAREDFKSIAGLTISNIQKLSHPILAIFGEYSHCLESLRRLQLLVPSCTAVVVPEAGHFHPVVKPAEFCQHVLRFLNNCAA